MDILNAIAHVLELEKKPLSMIEIWSKISELGLLPKSEFDRINNATKSGKIVGVYSGYLDTLLSRSSTNTKRADSNKKNLFEIVGLRPNMKYKLVGKNEEDKLIDVQKMTFIEAAQLILKQNDNQPMSAREIWDEIEEQDLVETSGATPWATLNASILTYADNSRSRIQRKIKLFHVVSDNPAMFILINPEQEVQPVEEPVEDDFSDMEEIRSFVKFPQPFDIEDELSKAQSQSEEDVISFKKFKATEPNEKPDELMIFNSYVKNPFSQSICVLGESGAGKSTTIDNILQKSGHVYQYIIPSASTTGLLSQFSPSAGAAGGYIPSRLGQMIEKAYNNKDVNYTAVFDECHKTSIIEMINDELLQAISKNRNKGVRFISLDDDTRRLYQSAQEDIRGNVLIPDNFGFIFISSNARVISGNPDFFNRVDLVELTVEDRKLQSIEDLNQKRVTSAIDKKELVNKIVSGGE
jgi:hypothetical protein